MEGPEISTPANYPYSGNGLFSTLYEGEVNPRNGKGRTRLSSSFQINTEVLLLLIFNLPPQHPSIRQRSPL